MFIIANWKSEIPRDVGEFLKRVNRRVVVAPPFAIKYGNLAAQNVSHLPSTTGEMSARILRGLGVKFCIVGHSERRDRLGEKREDVYVKVQELINNNITPMLCTDDEVLEADIDFLNKTPDRVVVIYEPKDYIGADQPMSGELLKKKVTYIKKATGREVVYGGGVNADNYQDIVKQGVDGLMMGRASLSIDVIEKITKDVFKI